MNAARLGTDVVWPNHDGSRARPEDVYLGDPHDSVGRIVSASTSESTSPGMKRAIGGVVLRILAGAALGGVGAGAGYAMAWIAANIAPSSEDLTLYAVAFFALVGAIAGFLLVDRKTATTYVGTDGVARFTKGRSGIEQTSLRWDQASALKFQQVRNYTNGVYTGTTYTFTWHGPDGGKLFQIGGHYSQKDVVKVPPQVDIHFAHAAETSWTAWRAGHMGDELAACGMLVFAVDKKNWIGLGDGFIELHFRDTVERLTPSDIEGMAMDAGFVTLRRQGARKGMFSSDGIFRFNANGMSNFRYFVLALDRLLGYRF